ncbi:heavy-metal-associated domain-containing protein [Microlunatus speluncae]|uniref:heavy-metal-associated domain-containing protein n=1 Tax=Microlunatus speluncae TaxID=2594267 RepID=UPI0012660854|nr:heavy metal-associated domain-containing protein [Microlunatus speluncae]
MTVAEYQVTGMSCAHCEAAIRSEVGRIDGVESIEVSADTGRLVITSAADVATDQVLAAVDEAGYTAQPKP